MQKTAKQHRITGKKEGVLDSAFPLSSMPLLPPSRFFPSAEDAEADGLIGFGGELSPEWLLDAYRHSIFPWPMGERDAPMPWFSPDPRAVIEFERFHVPKRLERVCRAGRFEIALDRDFPGVIRGCAAGRGRKGGTWLTPKMIAAYIHLHELGHAHSVEAWQDGRLAGGIYGVAIAGLFAAESMFYRVPEASKVALVHLVEQLRKQGYALLDIQQLTPHTARFGAIEIPRREYLRRLAEALEKQVEFS
jgi:leucyl/phenylalanyl-tRNA---protein transferase